MDWRGDRINIELHLWHLFIVFSGLIVWWVFVPVPNDTFGAGSFIKFLIGVALIPTVWLVYFAGRFLLG